MSRILGDSEQNPANKYKVESILNMKPPKNIRHVRKIIGLVNYYRDMLSIQSNLFQLLTKFTSKEVTFWWTAMEKNSFDEIKRVMSRDILLLYPDFNKWFDIHMDASDY